MPTVTVCEKLYGSFSPAVFEEFYSSLVSGLKVQLHFAGVTDHGWIQLNVSGEDETAALSLLDQEAGLLSSSFKDLSKFSVVKAKIISNGRDDGLEVDLGIICSEPYAAVISKQQLNAQLADGKNIPLNKLIKLFCLYENVPLEVKLAEDIKEEKKTIEVVLSEAQVSVFHSWVRSRLDHLIILGSLHSDVMHAVKSSRHIRDVIKIDSLGLLEQSVLCKLGTDAIGLIPKLGRYLKSAVLVPFSPKKILEVVDSQVFDGI